MKPSRLVVLVLSALAVETALGAHPQNPATANLRLPRPPSCRQLRRRQGQR